MDVAFQFIHRETGSEIREYAKSQEIRGADGKVIAWHERVNRDGDMDVLINERGIPCVAYWGYYNDGIVIDELSPSEWEIRWWTATSGAAKAC